MRVEATEHYDDQSPEVIIQGLLETHGNIESDDIDIDAMDTSHNLYTQWVDENLSDILEELCDHFEYFQYWDIDGNYTLKKVDPLRSPDHLYTSSNLVNFTPDDSFASFINRVTVKGEARELLEVTHPEEMVGSVNGTFGYYGGTERHNVYYSEDSEKKCLGPRLVIQRSIKDFKILMGIVDVGGSEYIESEDPDHRYCVVKVECEDMTGWLGGQIGLLITLAGMATGCDTQFKCGLYMGAITIVLTTIMDVLGAIGNYQYEVWAKPMGEERQTIQCVANDTDLQFQLNGMINNDSMDDPHCYYVTECCRVAQYELSIAKAQRRRVNFDKISHLQDEVGDCITIQHPITGDDMNIYVAELERRLVKPERPGGSGGMTDKITGWRQVT
jgi:hypothetical protein